jgi:hypothetical protein
VYCGASPGTDPGFLALADGVGRLLAEQGIDVVYGGGRVGLMGALADGALAAGGRVTGVMPKGLFEREIAHRELSELRVVGSMHERKALMAELADGFMTLPGGFGTLDELCEIITWTQLGLHNKPIGIVNYAGFFDPLLAMFDRSVANGFIRQDFRDRILVAADPSALLVIMRAYTAPTANRWSDGVKG